jgi:GT2 family glycosyltransferase
MQQPLDSSLNLLLTDELASFFWRPNRLGVESAWYGHIPFAHWIIRVTQPRILVELGTHNGVSYSAFCEAVARHGFDTKCYAVDSWLGDAQAGFYSEEVYADFCSFNRDHYGAFSELLRCTFTEALQHFVDGSIDLLHIDGLHTYEAVSADFLNWRPKLSERAVVLLHDTNVRQADFGVYRLWDELVQEFPGFEFLHGHGLGVLAVGSAVPEMVLWLCSQKNTEIATRIRDRFSFLGERWVVSDELRSSDARNRDLGSQLEKFSEHHSTVVERLENELKAKSEHVVNLGSQLEKFSEHHSTVVERLENELKAKSEHIVDSTTRLQDSRVAQERLALELAQREAELNRRDDLDRQMRQRSAERARLARAETFDLLQKIARIPAAHTETAKAEPDVGNSEPEVDALRLKAAILEQSMADLDRFLQSGERLAFPHYVDPDVSVVIVLYNQAQFTFRCLQRLRSEEGVNFEVVLLDNNSTDRTEELLSRLDNVQVLRKAENLGFLLGVNEASLACRGRNLLLLNSDAFVRSGALRAALAALDGTAAVGAVGGRLILPSHRVQEAGNVVWRDGSTLGYCRGRSEEDGEVMFRREVDYCSGAFLLTPRKLFEKLGRLNSAFAPAYFEEVDYCLRLCESGYRVIYEPAAVVDHYEFGSEWKSGAAFDLMTRNRKLLRSNHAKRLNEAHLPASNDNLLLARQRPIGQSRILVIDNEVPLASLGRGYPRMRAFLNRIVTDGWFVTFYPLLFPSVDWVRTYAELSPTVEIAANLGIEKLEDFLTERQGYYNIVLVSRPDNMTPFRRLLNDKPHLLTGAQLIYDAEAIFTNRKIVKAELNGTPLSHEQVDAEIAEEIAMTQEADAILAVTPEEARIFRERQSKPVYILGHSVRPNWNTPGFERRSGYLFVGRLVEKDSPNYQGLLWFLDNVWPLICDGSESVYLTIVGAVHPDTQDLRRDRVRLMGELPELSTVYDQARVFIAPVRFAAGIPIKILEASASGLPVVSTTLMAKQLVWSPGVEIFAQDPPEQFAEAALALYTDALKWEQVRLAALERVARDHSEEKFARVISELLGQRQLTILSETRRLERE